MTALFKAGLGRKNGSSACQPSWTPFFSQPSPSLSPSSTSAQPTTPAPPYPQLPEAFLQSPSSSERKPFKLVFIFFR